MIMFPFFLSYQDVDHQKGLDLLCGTPLSPSQQAQKSCKLWHIKCF